MFEKITLTMAQVNGTLTSELESKFNTLFPNWVAMVTTLLSLIILMSVLGPLVYKGIKKMVAKRQKYIQDNINHAEEMNNQAIGNRQKASQEILQARTIASEIITKAKLEAEQIKTTNLTIARDEANKIIALAKKDIQREKDHFEVESKKEIIQIAMVAAKKIIEKEVDSTTNKKIIEDFINKE